MRNLVKLFRLIFCQLILFFALVEIASANNRVALVIGNAKYQGDFSLKKPVGDAEAIGRVLNELQFQVMLVTDLNRSEMEEAVKAFLKKATGAQIAVIFFSGHGIQIDNQNYLVPIDATLDNKDTASFELLDLNKIVSTLENKAALTLFFIDASRSNISIKADNKTRSDARGLTVLRNSNFGSLISFSAKPGTNSIPSEGEHSHYVQALLDYLISTDLSVSQMMTQVRRAVFEGSSGRQVSRDYNSLLEEVYLAPLADRLSNHNSTESSELKNELEQLQLQLAKLQDGGTNQAGSESQNEYKIGETFRDCENCPEMIVIPNGKFRIGSPRNEEKRQLHEGPRKQIKLGRPFALGRYEVTHGEFKRFMRATGLVPRNRCWDQTGFIRTDNQPVVCVDIREAKAFTRWLSEESGKNYRLPSEAEWEYSARAGTNTMFGYGTKINPTVANYVPFFQVKFSGANRNDEQVFAAPAPVNALKANNFGLFHMHGNATEFVADCYRKSYDQIPVDGEAYTEKDCRLGISRGGGWQDEPWRLRSASRRARGFWESSTQTGFRVARSLENSEFSTDRIVPEIQGVDLAIAMQEQLNRLGCLSGGIDGIWGNGSRRALRKFYQSSNSSLEYTEPTQSILGILISTQRRVCAR